MNSNVPTRSDRGVFFFLALALFTLALFSLLSCSTTGTEYVRVDQTDRRDAVHTEPPDTVVVDSIRVDTLWEPGMTFTVPETVRVARDEPTAQDTTDAFPLQEIVLDSAHVRLAGLTEQYTLSSPCFGQSLVGRSVSGEMQFYVEGECVQRDTVVEATYEKQSWVGRTLDKTARWISLVALLGIGLYILWGTISTTIRAALPW